MSEPREVTHWWIRRYSARRNIAQAFEHLRVAAVVLVKGLDGV